MLTISRIQRSPVLQAVPLPPGTIPSEILINEELGTTRIYKPKVGQPPNSFNISPASPNKDDIHQASTREQVEMVLGEIESVCTDKVSLKQFLKLKAKRRGAVCEKIEENINLVKINGARMNLFDLRNELLQLPLKEC